MLHRQFLITQHLCLALCLSCCCSTLFPVVSLSSGFLLQDSTRDSREEMSILCSLMLLLFFLLLSCYLTTSTVLALTADGLSLLSLKSAIDEAGSDPVSYASVFSDWNEDDDSPCLWTGISCMKLSGFRDPRVVGVSLSNKNLRGYIPSELGTLVYLRRLNLHSNSFYGPIPLPLFNASSLHSLFLYGNNFSGVLPPDICNLPRLQNLDVSNNSLTGVISSGFNKCKELQRFLIGNNKFYGEIPKGIWPVMENLVQLDLSANDFTGPIPDDLGELKSLTGSLNLSYNHFTGKLPMSLANLPATVSFDLRGNNLSGEIPQTGAFANQGPTAFLNNPLLCGFPLQKPCGGSQESPSQNSLQRSDHSNSKKGLKPGLIILISVADAAGVAFIGLVIVYIYWKKKDSDGCSCAGKEKLGGNNQRAKMCPCICARGGFSANDSEAGQSDKESSNGGGGSTGGNRGEGDLVAIDKGFSFELDELLRASAYVLGKSGLGIVYKVVLGNGVPVAVRRLGEGGEQRYKEFTAEIQAIGKVKHPNIVKLRAYYWAPDEKLLISDFISNGNLASALRGRNGQASTSLSWSVRLKIAKGAARGLAYLHECSPRKYVHGDVKPSNILLDNDFQAHISDFGLNRLISITGSNNSNNNNPSSSSGWGVGFMGAALPYMKPSTQTEKTNNYRSPEAHVTGNKPTQKWDVYSFGVVLLELLTGKSPELSPSTSSSTSYSVEVTDLVRWVRKGLEEEKALLDMVDPTFLQEAYAKKQVLAAFHVALACTEADPDTRPKMKSVSENLNRI